MKGIILSFGLVVTLSYGFKTYAMDWGFVTSSSDEIQEHPDDRDHGHGGDFHRPPPGHGHGDEHGGHYVDHPGFRGGFHYYDPGHGPVWIGRPHRPFLAFTFVLNIQPGYWQCTAFNQGIEPFSDVGPTQEQAAYGALYSCGGPDYAAAGCYIPDTYCRPR